MGNKKEKSKLTPCVQPCPPSHQRNLNRSRLTLPQRYHSPRQNATHIMHKDKECFLVISTEKPRRAIMIRCPPYFFGRAVAVGDGEASFSSKPSPSRLRRATSPEGGGFGKGRKYTGYKLDSSSSCPIRTRLIVFAKGSPFERLPPAGGRCCRQATKRGTSCRRRRLRGSSLKPTLSCTAEQRIPIIMPYKMRTRITAGIAESFSASWTFTAPVASSIV